MEPWTIKPERTAFIVWPFITGNITMVIVIVFLCLAGSFKGIPLWFSIPVLTILAVINTVLGLGTSKIRYDKTSFTLHDDRITGRMGGVFRDATVDIKFQNVTQVSISRPYMQHRILGVGNVSVTAAGGGGGATIGPISDPEGCYEQLVERLKVNGFSLSRQHLVQEERPRRVAVMLSEGPAAIVGLVFLLMVGAFGVYVMAGLTMDILGYEEWTQVRDLALGVDGAHEAATRGRPGDMRVAVLGLSVLMVAGVFAIMVRQVLTIMEHTRRRYRVFEDMVEFEDDFLSKRRCIIPRENLADVSIRQRLTDRIMGVATVRVSCQGVAGTIIFRHLPNGQAMRANLEELIDGVRPLAAGAGVVSTPDGLADAQPAKTDSDPRPATAGAGPELVFRPSYRKYLVESLISMSHIIAVGAAAYIVIIGVAIPHGLPLIPADLDPEPFLRYTRYAFFGLAAVLAFGVAKGLIQTALAYRATRYRVGTRRLGSHFALASRHDVEFTMEMVTMVRIHQDITARMMGTATIAFYSIGTGVPITFRDVRIAPADTDEILHRLGISGAAPDRAIRPSLSIAALLCADLGRWATSIVWIVVGIAAVVLLHPAALLVPALVVARLIHRLVVTIVQQRHIRLDVVGDYVLGSWGVLAKHRCYALLRHIKDVRTVRFPFVRTGRMTLFVGGGARHSMTYLKGVHRLHDELDDLLQRHPPDGSASVRPLDTRLISATRPSLRTPLVRRALPTMALISFALFVWPMILAVPPLIIDAVMRTLRTRYRLEGERVVSISGLYVRTKQTILINRIDYLRTEEGAANKILGTGGVTVYTTGSSGPELMFRDIRGHRDWHDTILERLPAPARVRSTEQLAPAGG